MVRTGRLSQVVASLTLSEHSGQCFTSYSNQSPWCLREYTLSISSSRHSCSPPKLLALFSDWVRATAGPPLTARDLWANLSHHQVIDHFCDKFYQRNFAVRGPEGRLYTAMVGGCLVPFGAFVYTFTSYSHIPWIAPVIGITVLYSGMLLIYLS